MGLRQPLGRKESHARGPGGPPARPGAPRPTPAPTQQLNWLPGEPTSGLCHSYFREVSWDSVGFSWGFIFYFVFILRVTGDTLWWRPQRDSDEAAGLGPTVTLALGTDELWTRGPVWRGPGGSTVRCPALQVKTARSDTLHSLQTESPASVGPLGPT